MIRRRLESEVRALLKEFPCVAILGPRQVGKTTLSRKLIVPFKENAIYLDLEKPSVQFKLHHAEAYLGSLTEKCIVLDEIQFMPGLYSILRSLIDEDRRPGRFLLTGSASPELIRGVSEFLAGRIAYVELCPIGITEVPKSISMHKHWFYGGFPLALTSPNLKKSAAWLDQFIISYLERDLNKLFGVALSPVLLKNFWRMIAFNNGGLLNSENYARALGVSGPTVLRYLDYLEGAFLIRRLYPWYININKRLVKSPKLYIRDSGLLHRLADIPDFDTLQGNLLIGASWEGYVIEQIIQLVPSDIRPFFYRTHDGAETDLLLVKQNKVLAAIEIKLNPQTPSRGLNECIKVLKPKYCFLIGQSNESFPLGENIQYCGLKDFLIKIDRGL